MLAETSDYTSLCRDFRWDIPARFNIATPMALAGWR
jgi:acetyl-CoA synthetase